MDKKLTLTTKAILDKTFTKNVKGYDPDQVDEFLDVVMMDYSVYDAKLKERDDYVRKLEDDNRRLLERLKTMETDNARMKNRLSDVKPGDKLNSENIEYIQRVNRLENFIYKLGYDPTKI